MGFEFYMLNEKKLILFILNNIKKTYYLNFKIKRIMKYINLYFLN